MNIILDLDETLIHAHSNRVPSFDFVISVVAQTPIGPISNQYWIKKRPGLPNFLRFIYKNFKTVSYWTAGTADYAHKILVGILTPKQMSKTAIVYSRCHLKVASATGRYYKPLSRIFRTKEAQRLNINKKNSIMIDDNAHNFIRNVGNGMLIQPFTGHAGDRVLCKLIIVLKGILDHAIEMGSFQGILELDKITN
jgi:TFIIF-interacting CTD phosphatase-like protein